MDANLEIIDLTGNKLMFIHVDAFAGPCHISHLVLHGNNLGHLPPLAAAAVNITDLSFCLCEVSLSDNIMRPSIDILLE